MPFWRPRWGRRPRAPQSWSSPGGSFGLIRHGSRRLTPRRELQRLVAMVACGFLNPCIHVGVGLERSRGACSAGPHGRAGRSCAPSARCRASAREDPEGAAPVAWFRSRPRVRLICRGWRTRALRLLRLAHRAPLLLQVFFSRPWPLAISVQPGVSARRFGQPFQLALSAGGFRWPFQLTVRAGRFSWPCQLAVPGGNVSRRTAMGVLIDPAPLRPESWRLCAKRFCEWRLRAWRLSESRLSESRLSE